MRKDSKILVTGFSGLLGTALCDKLREQGFTDIHGLNTKNRLEDKSAADKMFNSVRPEYVFHLAARVHGIGGNVKSPVDVLTENTIINLNVVSAARACGAKKIVAMGSGCVYPSFRHKPHEGEIFEGKPHHSEFAYAHAKRHMLAHLMAEKQQFDLEYAFVASGNLYGPYDKFNPEIGHVIPSLIAKFCAAEKDGTMVEVWGNGSAARDFMYSEDAAEALITIMEKVEGTINLGSDEVHTIGNIVALLRILFPSVYVKWDGNKPNGQSYRAYNLNKLRDTGFKAKTEIMPGLQKTVKWYKATYGY